MAVILTMYATILTLAVWQEQHGRDGEADLADQNVKTGQSHRICSR